MSWGPRTARALQDAAHEMLYLSKSASALMPSALAYSAAHKALKECMNTTAALYVQLHLQHCGHLLVAIVSTYHHLHLSAKPAFALCLCAWGPPLQPTITDSHVNCAGTAVWLAC